MPDQFQSARSDNSQCYDSFTFMDRLTKNKLNFKEARSTCQGITKNKRRNSKASFEKSILGELSNTKAFELLCIRNKVFKRISFDVEGSDSSELGRVIAYKNKLRKEIDNSIERINKREFKKILSVDGTSVCSDILDLNTGLKQVKTALDKDKIEEIFYIETQGVPKIKKKKKYIIDRAEIARAESERFVNFLSTNNFNEDLEGRLRRLTAEESEYLV